MAFRLSPGSGNIDMTPASMSREIQGEDVVVSYRPCSPEMEEVAQDRQMVRADIQHGMIPLGDMRDFQRELAVEVMEAWTVLMEDGTPAKITTKTITYFEQADPAARVMVRDVVVDAKKLFRDRNKAVQGEDEGN